MESHTKTSRPDVCVKGVLVELAALRSIRKPETAFQSLRELAQGGHL